MTSLAFKAHFDGQQILLDEPAQLEPGTQLLITVVSPELQAEHGDWLRLSQRGLARAYGDDEPEYTLEDCIEVYHETR